MPQHRIEFMQFLHPTSDVLQWNIQLRCQVFLLSLGMRQEFVKWWIEKTDRRREAFEHSENPDEITPLIWQQFCNGRFPFIERLSEDHLAHCIDPIAFKEHMLGPAKARSEG